MAPGCILHVSQYSTHFASLLYARLNLLLISLQVKTCGFWPHITYLDAVVYPR